MDKHSVVLYRPVGLSELKLIEASGWRRFPPRLPEQPIFYPVLTETYAHQIARDWNATGPDGAGHVLAFNVAADFLEQYEVHQVGGKDHREYWIPAEDLERFNDHIVGPIRLVHSYWALAQLVDATNDDALDCPVCGLENAFETPRAYDTCLRCGWADDPVQYAYPDAASGDNQPMTLRQARLAWKSGQRVDEWRRQHIDALNEGHTPVGFPPPHDLP